MSVAKLSSLSSTDKETLRKKTVYPVLREKVDELVKKEIEQKWFFEYDTNIDERLDKKMQPYNDIVTALKPYFDEADGLKRALNWTRTNFISARKKANSPYAPKPKPNRYLNSLNNTPNAAPNISSITSSNLINNMRKNSHDLHNHLSSPLKFLDTAANEPIILNIGGIKYQTTKTTLSKYQECLLYKMFEGKFSTNPNRDGSYFIDRNGKYFEYILDYLRNGILNIPISNNNSYLINHLLCEADYYQIQPLIKQLKFLKIGSKLLKPKNLLKIEEWILEEFPKRNNKIFQWKLLYEWNCDDITLKNPYNVMHAKCEGISGILIVLLCGNRIFGAYSSVKWKAKDVNDNESFVYCLGNEVISNHDNDDDTSNDDDNHENESKHNNNNNQEDKDTKYKFNYDSYREFRSFDSNSENHRCMKFCGGYNDVVVCRYRAAKHQYGHFSIYTNETGYTVTASGPLSLDNSIHLQRMEIFHI